MSSVGLSSALGGLSHAAQTTSIAKTASANETSTATTSPANGGLKEDTVKLSLAAQAKLMHKQGQSASVIAASLGTSVASVDGYLNIKVATQASATTTVSAASTEAASTPAVATGAGSSGTSASSTATSGTTTAQAASAAEVAKS